ncbi:MAG: M14 family zinc carboxypeptidase [Alphaproteobacteria bacterium]
MQTLTRSMIRTAGILGAAALFAVMLTHGEGAAAKPIPTDPPAFADVIGTGLDYDAAIPKPADVIGHAVGARMARFDRIVAYIRAVDAASDRVTVKQLTTTPEGRPILLVTSTSPANHARLDEIRTAHLAAVDPETDGAGNAELPAILQFVHGVHGDEISGTESAMLLAYHFAAAKDAKTTTLLDNAIIHQVVTLNPDGFDRYGAWVNLHLAERPNPDRAHREHRNPWPAGRVNHYWFDLNRQWLPATQVESKAVVAQTHRWLPQVVTDLHEMGSNSTYFYSPGPPDNLHPLLDAEGVSLTRLLNTDLARQLDSEKALSVSEEVFDDFYLGYGSSYPALLGGIGILFEQSSSDGIQIDTVNGLKQYAEKIGQHFRVALALSHASARERTKLRGYQRRYLAEERKRGATGETKAYVFQSTDRARMAAFLDLMALHNIRVNRLADPLTIGNQTFLPESAFVVALEGQRYTSLIHGLFEVRPITEKVEFYDVSGWTLPLAYGLSLSAVDNAAVSGLKLGDPIKSLPRTGAMPDRAPLAYLFEWREFTAPRALYRLLEQDLRAKVVPDPITAQTTKGKKALDRGAIIVPVAQDALGEDDLHALMVQIAKEDGITVHAATTSVTPKGSDLGGFEVAALTMPKVLLVTGRGTSQYDVGELWFLLDQHINMPVTMVDIADLGRTDLDDYTHIVMAGGRYGAVRADAIAAWVRRGGTLVATQSAAEWAVAQGVMDVSMLGVESSEEGEDKGAAVDDASEDTGDSEDDKPKRLPYAQKRSYEASRLVSGAIFKGDLDITHPVGWGYESRVLPLHREGAKAFKHTDNPFAMVVQYGEGEPRIAGYASEENRERVAGLGAVMADRVGRGSVILFADNPFFRAYWYGTAKMFMNALFFSKAFSGHSPDPYREH